MKRASFLKIVSVVMVVAMMISTTIGAYAASSITASQNPADTTINISGNIDNANPYEDNVVVVIFREGVATDRQNQLMSDFSLLAAAVGTDVLGIGQATVGTNGVFECDVTIKDVSTNGTGHYTVVAAAPTGTQIATPFYFVPSEGKLDILKDIISERNASSLQGDINLNKSVFAFDMNTMWNDVTTTYQTAAAQALISDNEIFAALYSAWNSDPTSVTLADVADVTLAIKQEVYAQAIINGLTTSAPPSPPAPLAVLSDMDQYADVSAYENAYDNYCSAAAQSDVDTNVGTGSSSFAELLKEYKEQILLGSVVKPEDDNGANSRFALDALASSAGLDTDSVTKYLASTPTNRQTVADVCKISGATTFATLNTEFINAVAALPDPETPAGTPTPGPGGGGGGGSIITVVQPTPTPSQKPIYERYNDVNDYEWAWDAVEVLSNKGIIAGYENGSFAPANSILREEFIKLAVVGLLGADAIDASAVASFTDAQSGWYAPYIAAAESNNITSGMGGGLFGTGAQITRQDMALMLYRILRGASVNGPADAYAFTDADEIADYAAEAVYTLKNMGIINGDPDGSFRPNGQTTRAEAAVLLYKTLDRLGKLVH